MLEERNTLMAEDIPDIISALFGEERYTMDGFLADALKEFIRREVQARCVDQDSELPESDFNAILNKYTG